MAAHRLAERLNCTVEELDERVTTNQFLDHLAYEQLSPPVGERVDYMISMLCTIVANAVSKKRFKMDDFLPKWGIGRKPKGGARTTAEIMKMFQDMPGVQIVKA